MATTYDLECEGCGETFTARSPRAKWCGAACKKRHQRHFDEADAPPAPADDSGLVESVRQELEAASVTDSFYGQLALQLARKMSAVDATGVSSLSKELRQVMAEAVGSITPTEPEVEEDDEVTLARKAREAKAAAAAESS